MFVNRVKELEALNAEYEGKGVRLGLYMDGEELEKQHLLRSLSKINLPSISTSPKQTLVLNYKSLLTR